MARLVDHEALVLDLRAELQERASWGRAQVLGLIDELEQRHRVDESAEAAVVRRFGSHFYDTFLGLVPRQPATVDPLGAGDPSGTRAPMDAGADSDHNDGRNTACPQETQEPARSHRPRVQDSPRVLA